MKRTEEYYSKLARLKDFPARSVFKLQEIQDRFSLLKTGQKVLDLGSAPGSWSQFCLQRIGSKGSLVGVDLEPVSFKVPPGKRYRFLQGDICSSEIAGTLGELGPYDLVLSDAAPRTTGSDLVDTQGSLEIVQRAIEIATNTLKPGGNLVVKVFQGGEEGQLLRQMRSLFRRARAFKPAASRNKSRETYFLGLYFEVKFEKKA
jgi:23S rRNA (uridine2552-2'-O)-methyltransferase